MQVTEVKAARLKSTSVKRGGIKLETVLLVLLMTTMVVTS